MSRPGDKAKGRSVDDWLGDMHRDASAIVRNTATATKEEFLANEVLQDHVVRRLTNIGEASKYVGQFFPEFRDRTTVIPWSKLARTRDVLNHAYFGTDPHLLWEMANSHIPPIHRDLGVVIGNRRSARALGQMTDRGRGF